MKVDYSIVVPVYFNEGSLHYTADNIFSKVFAVVPELCGEIIFVDDGSGDNSLKELLEIRESHPNEVRVVKLSRNFGQVNAIWCGLNKAPGAVITISADGQDPAALIVDMLKKHFNDKIEVVVAVRESREESLWRKWTSGLVYSAIRKLGCKDMPTGGFDFLLLGEHAKKALIRDWQPNTFFQVRVLELGFKREFIPYHREDRKSGVSKWTFSKKLTYMIDGVLGHSYVPIRAISVLGLMFSGISFVLAIFFFVSYFFNPSVIMGWTPIILLILFIGGVQMMMIGVLGEYLWRVLAQTRNAMPYIVECEYGFDDDGKASDE